MWTDRLTPKEGELYKQLTVAGHSFELRYGYYEESERDLCPPVVLYPNLIADPRYSAEGYPLVTHVQDACEHCRTADEQEAYWCSDCIHYSREHREIGVCRCEHRRNKSLAGGNEYEKHRN